MRINVTLRLALASARNDVPDILRGEKNAIVYLDRDIARVVLPRSEDNVDGIPPIIEAHVSGTCKYLGAIVDSITYSEFIPNVNTK